MAVVTSASTISFPSNTSDNPISPQVTGVYPNLPNISSELSYERTTKASLRASALEVHDLVWLASSRNVQGRLNQLYESNAVYKNTFVTATSLSIISDIHSLTHQLCEVRIPKPTTLIARILGYQTTEAQMWVAWRIWSEIGTVCETESFGKRNYTEYELGKLSPPGNERWTEANHNRAYSAFSIIRGLGSPIDICDLRELLYLIPGGHAVQSVTTRFTAIGLAGLSRLGFALSRSADSMWDVSPHVNPGPQPDNVAKRRVNASDPHNVLGMPHSQREYSHAPDTDSV
ncbi:hypothetical protein RhiXN_04398 [Rhizoctonia solani]|uniref:Uncharacterized protein n=1 Tax=Rhizoctonia solani TaxID=456999 RepID=A0A8H8NQE4_9AGAM|nr:uncharacterized protein RhiXN_04398 [Rhizoctonia solani]QRW16397.1 hypothetical protein RhiXN_04398 [Rhizoctonia solani]